MGSMGATLRVATIGDAAAIAAIYAPYVTDTVISFEERPPTAEEMAQRLAKTLPQYPWLVAEADGKVVGYAYGGRFAERAAYRWSVETTVYVRQDSHRAGIGRSLYELLIVILIFQGYHSAFGGITLPNAASIGLHEAMGFEPVGIYKEVGFKFGRWLDVGWWRLGLLESRRVPHDILPPFRAPHSPMPFELFQQEYDILNLR